MIDSDTIQKIAQLARLKMTSEEAQEYGAQLSKVLAHFQQIEKIDTQGIEPLVTPTEIEFYLREDSVQQDNSTEEILKNAPEKGGNLFKVPPVV